MLSSTLARICCPGILQDQSFCLGELTLNPVSTVSLSHLDKVSEVVNGHLQCKKCKAKYPILQGVAILVPNVREYLVEHARGIATLVDDLEIPREHFGAYLAAKPDEEDDPQEWDLETERVSSLYLMNHYLHANLEPWWESRQQSTSPLIGQLIREYWDHGPMKVVRDWLEADLTSNAKATILDLGCNVGGVYSSLVGSETSYLGVDHSFLAIALARHMALGMPYRGQSRIPGDLLKGAVSREVDWPKASLSTGLADFVVGDLYALPAPEKSWSLVLAMNLIDMLDDPMELPRIQKARLQTGGRVIQSSPYIWSESVATGLRETFGKKIRSSAELVAQLYQRNGFRVARQIEHVPWLFYKHLRQLEIYSVHVLEAFSEL